MSLVCVWWTWTEKSHSYSLPHLESIVKDWVQAPVCRAPNTNFDFHKAFSLHLLIQHNPASLFHIMILYFMAITLSKWKEKENCRWRKGRMSKFWQLESCLSIGGMTDFYLVHIALCPGLRAINWLVIRHNTIWCSFSFVICRLDHVFYDSTCIFQFIPYK